MKALLFALLFVSFGCNEPTCVVTGCSGNVCSDKEVMSTCEFTEYYSCFKQATCTRIENACGWKPNDEFIKCLKDKGAPDSVIQQYQQP